MTRAALAIGLLALIAAYAYGRAPMSNDQVIIEVKKCRDAGLCFDRLINVWTLRTKAIQCVSCDEEGR